MISFAEEMDFFCERAPSLAVALPARRLRQNHSLIEIPGSSGRSLPQLPDRVPRISPESGKSSSERPPHPGQCTALPLMSARCSHRSLRCSCPRGCGTDPCLDTCWILALRTHPPGTAQDLPRGTGLGSLRGTARCTAGRCPRCWILSSAPPLPPLVGGGEPGGESVGRVGGKILLYLRLYFSLLTWMSLPSDLV